jgi:uncharacterized membrane protein YbaN (DUF454 family)
VPPPTRPPLPRPLRWLWLVAGVLLTALGLIGAVVPLLPTTVFLILAAGCFARSSPKLEARLLDDPRVGPAIRDWRERGAISPRGKLLAVGGMTGGYTVFLLAARPELPVSLLVAALMALVAAWILSRSS